MRRLISPWEYHHLRVFGVMRIAGGSVAVAAGGVCLSYDVYGWAAFFLVLGVLNLAGGWFLDEVDSGFQDALGPEPALGVAGHEEDPGGGLEDADLAGEFLRYRASVART